MNANVRPSKYLNDVILQLLKHVSAQSQPSWLKSAAAHI